jgi:hypothetical protein
VTAYTPGAGLGLAYFFGGGSGVVVYDVIAVAPLTAATAAELEAIHDAAA